LFNILIAISIVTGAGLVTGYLLQSPKASGLGAIGGTAHQFKMRSGKDAFYDKLVVWSAILFGISIFLLSIIDPKLWL
jgi:protein translocase SecG subunit